MTLLVLSDDTVLGKAVEKLRDILDDEQRMLLLEAYARFLLPAYIGKLKEQVQSDDFKNAWTKCFDVLQIKGEESQVLLADFIKSLDSTVTVVRHRKAVDIDLQERQVGKVQAGHLLSLIEYGAPGVPAVPIKRNVANFFMRRANEYWKEFKDKYDNEISELEVDALTGNI